MKAKYILILLISMLFCSSCSEYSRLMKSSDNDLKFAKAKEYYQRGKYLQAATLLESVIIPLRGTEKGEEALYMVASSYYGNRDYLTARGYY